MKLFCKAFTKKLPSAGFTLIEVVVALAILTWVLSSAFFLVKQYADERSKMRARFHGNQVSWNQLMSQYRLAQEWTPNNQDASFETSGEEYQAGQQWHWVLQRTPASGENLFLYKATTYEPSEKLGTKPLDSTKNKAASLSIFLLDLNK